MTLSLPQNILERICLVGFDELERLREADPAAQSVETTRKGMLALRDLRS